jgi:hypothetical protein
MGDWLGSAISTQHFRKIRPGRQPGVPAVRALHVSIWTFYNPGIILAEIMG